MRKISVINFVSENEKRFPLHKESNSFSLDFSLFYISHHAQKDDVEMKKKKLITFPEKILQENGKLFFIILSACPRICSKKKKQLDLEAKNCIHKITQVETDCVVVFPFILGSLELKPSRICQMFQKGLISIFHMFPPTTRLNSHIFSFFTILSW